MQRLIFLGAGGIATVAADIARSLGFEIAGFLDDRPERHGSDFCNGKILGGFDLLPQLRQCGIEHVVVAFGDCHARLVHAQKVISAGFQLPKLIHPSALIGGNVDIGPGTILMPGTIVNGGSRVGANVILNTAASVDHDCVIGDGVHIAPGARLSGGVTVGRATWIGIGSVVKEKINIGSDTMVGAGSLVLKDVPNGVVAYGSPAKVVRANSPAK